MSEITFNLQSAITRNYFRGSKPSNDAGNCWTTHASCALVFTIAQVRKMRASLSHGSIIIEPTDREPLTDLQFDHELYCIVTDKHWDSYQGG